MKTEPQSKISNWLIWQPLKFAGTLFVTSCIIIFLYSALCTIFQKPISIPTAIALSALVFIYCTVKLIQRLPKHKMDRTSFVMIQNAQTILYFVGTLLSLVLFINYGQEYITETLYAQHRTTLWSYAFLILLSTIALSIIGLKISNLYAKFLRIRSLGIPTYKIFLTMPFGFSALWIPGYILPSASKEQQSYTTKIKWYNKFTKWTVRNLGNCITAFILICICPGLFTNLNATLLQIMLALIFGIWAMQIGAKKFTTKINGGYTTFAIIANIILLIGTIFIFTLGATHSAPDVEINITETTVIQGLQQ